MRQWRQVQPLRWSNKDIYDTETFELQRFLRKLQDPESGPCSLLQELWDKTRLVTLA